MMDMISTSRRRLSQFTDAAACTIKAHHYLVREGELPSRLHVVLEGWACRYKLLADGRRQITALYLPGDVCDLSWLAGLPANQHVIALTHVRTESYAVADIRQSRGDPRFADLLMGHAGVDGSAEWLVNLGRKTALEKLCHLFCEIFHRMRHAGLSCGQQCAMPLTQIDLADLTGLTPVHVNRTLQEMRRRGMVELRAKWLRILNHTEIQQTGLFHENYLPMVPSAESRMLWVERRQSEPAKSVSVSGRQSSSLRPALILKEGAKR
jgi:CRP-like cAMP-binding protein